MWYNIITVKDRYKSLKPEGIITMTIYNRRQFEKWILDQLASLDKFMSELEDESHGLVNCVDWAPETARTYGNFVISVNKDGDTTIYNTKTGKSGKARLNPKDTSYMFLGLALAWARYMKKEIPVLRATTKISNLKVGDVVNIGRNDNDNFIVLSIVPNIKENAKNDIAITFMEWDGKRSSFYYGDTKTVIKNKMGSMDVVDHVNL